uniref:RAD1 checkpoint DNA exonuclease n=1 Tax=Myotis myotis TaxID=51298 RepID=A0A7J7Y1L3_MYOMY|nr:RAD1 checkpoint DNA exonuclease [Myotis myotis]
MVTVAETARRSESCGGSRSTSSPFPRELHLAYPVTWERLPGVRTPPLRCCGPPGAGAGAGAAPDDAPRQPAGPRRRRLQPGGQPRQREEPLHGPEGHSFPGSRHLFRHQKWHQGDGGKCEVRAGECVHPGNLTALRMCYQGYGCPLMLFLEEGGVVTVCKINTQEPEETLDFDFCSTNVINKIILQSEGLREAFSELDMTSEVLQITMSPDKPYFRLSTFGNAGSSHLDYPKDSDLMESFNCNETQVNRYKISLLKPSTKALVLSCKVSIRTDNRGFLSLQYMIRNEDGQICFVEYYCCPDEEVPDSES